MDLTQQDVSLYGPGGGPREYGSSEGRMNGGGWLNGPVAFSDYDGLGIVAPGPEADPQKAGPNPSPMMGGYGSSPILDSVEAIGDMGRWFG